MRWASAKSSKQVKFGTYPATLTAADWDNILLALDSAGDAYKALELPRTAAAFARTFTKVYEQVTEDRWL